MLFQGLHYLHSNKNICHGRLTSNNCVIDSRFCLKLTDYGLTTVYKKEREFEKSENTFNMNSEFYLAVLSIVYQIL